MIILDYYFSALIILYELYLTVDICKEFANNWLDVGANVHYKAKENAKTSGLKLMDVL